MKINLFVIAILCIVFHTSAMAESFTMSISIPITAIAADLNEPDAAPFVTENSNDLTVTLSVEHGYEITKVTLDSQGVGTNWSKVDDADPTVWELTGFNQNTDLYVLFNVEAVPEADGGGGGTVEEITVYGSISSIDFDLDTDNKDGLEDDDDEDKVEYPNGSGVLGVLIPLNDNRDEGLASRDSAAGYFDDAETIIGHLSVFPRKVGLWTFTSSNSNVYGVDKLDISGGHALDYNQDLTDVNTYIESSSGATSGSTDIFTSNYEVTGAGGTADVVHGTYVGVDLDVDNDNDGNVSSGNSQASGEDYYEAHSKGALSGHQALKLGMVVPVQNFSETADYPTMTIQSMGITGQTKTDIDALMPEVRLTWVGGDGAVKVWTDGGSEVADLSENDGVILNAGGQSLWSQTHNSSLDLRVEGLVAGEIEIAVQFRASGALIHEDIVRLTVIEVKTIAASGATEVTDVLGNQLMKHFATPKSETAGDKVTLDITIEPSNADTKALISWVNATEDAGDPLKATVLKDAAIKHEVRIKIGPYYVRKDRVWVNWTST